ncbi:MAG: UvrD-helicase domain-containing protein, partial [Candidatus Brocadiae bacterium]|nr:UvrD-helicase domain-containing protein [Candidatus Brocadiia bacterium]
CVRLLRGFAEEFRDACLPAGRLSFDGLLALARTLASASPRAARRFRDHVFLVDEFQDTDERQAEIVLRLASPFTAPGADWRTLVPRPGSVFVVGDPKQSIYAWRGADLGVYDSVCAQLVAGGALDLELTRNFRCQPGVVDAVNAVFGSAFVHEPGIQASPATLVAARALKSLSGRIVTLRTAPDAGDAPSAARAEAAAIGNWIRDNRGKLRIEVEDGDAVVDKPMRFRDIAILLRQSTHLQEYLHALRERRIPYVVTREQFFYEAQEIRDAINLLLAVARPDDALSLAGVMRSPVGGLTFEDILAAGTPDSRDNPPGRAGDLFALLRDLRSRALRLPVAEAVHLILDESGLRAAAAISAHGEQALANLDKLASLAARWTSPDLSLAVFADRLGRRLLDVEREAESPLAEPDDEVVRVSTIHAAKGLEWPVVILAGLHTPPRRAGTEDLLLRSAGGFAARAGEATTPAWAWLADESRRREDAERVRLFYVACTRAREALVLSRCGPGNGAFLDLVPPGAFQEEDADAAAAVRAPHVQGLAHPSVGEKDTWRLRREEWEREMKTPAIDSPSGLMHREEDAPRVHGHAWESRFARDLGILVHRVLERWNFAGDDLDAALARASADLPAAARGEVLPRARDMLAAFLSSDAAKEIAAGTILGREVPFSMPLDGVRCIVGVIDLLFEKDGRLHIRDYKTGGESRRYETQESIYAAAVRRVVPDREATFRFLWLGGEPARKSGSR